MILTKYDRGYWIALKKTWKEGKGFRNKAFTLIVFLKALWQQEEFYNKAKEKFKNGHNKQQ